MPKISVIIPVYNTEKYLRQCLDSIINQTLKDIEIICVDDNSTDGSLAILQEYAQKDERIKILKGKGTGAGGARNVGLENAIGEYLSFIDSDDFIELNTYEKLYNYADHNNSDVVVFNMNRFDTNKEIFMEYQNKIIPDCVVNQIFSVETFPNIIFNAFLDSASNKIFKTDVVIKNQIKFQEIKRTNDAFFSRSLLILSERIFATDEVFLHYRVGNTTNLQSSYLKTPFEFTKALLGLKKFLDERDLYKKFKHSYHGYAICIINHHLRLLKISPIAYFRLRWFLLKNVLPQIELDLKETECWSFIRILLSWIFSIRNFRYTEYKIITLFGFSFRVKRRR